MYDQSITRNHRTAFIILIDGSGSMEAPISFRGRNCSKAEAVATITNELLFELIERARRHDWVRDYYDIALLRYSGEDEVRSLLDEKYVFHSVVDLADRKPRIAISHVECRQPNGSIGLREVHEPRWIEPYAAGHTPMIEALRIARDLVAGWMAREEHADSFPPIIFNITDGTATDGSPTELMGVCRRIQQLGTTNGRVLLMQLHIGDEAEPQSLFFPSESDFLKEDADASLLYDCASQMPPCFNEAIQAIKGAGAQPPFRGMGYNTSASELVMMLDIGSRSVKTE